MSRTYDYLVRSSYPTTRPTYQTYNRASLERYDYPDSRSTFGTYIYPARRRNSTYEAEECGYTSRQRRPPPTLLRERAPGHTYYNEDTRCHTSLWGRSSEPTYTRRCRYDDDPPQFAFANPFRGRDGVTQCRSRTWTAPEAACDAACRHRAVYIPRWDEDGSSRTRYSLISVRDKTGEVADPRHGGHVQLSVSRHADATDILSTIAPKGSNRKVMVKWTDGCIDELSRSTSMRHVHRCAIYLEIRKIKQVHWA